MKHVRQRSRAGFVDHDEREALCREFITNRQPRERRQHDVGFVERSSRRAHQVAGEAPGSLQQCAVRLIASPGEQSRLPLGKHQIGRVPPRPAVEQRALQLDQPPRYSGRFASFGPFHRCFEGQFRVPGRTELRTHSNQPVLLQGFPAESVRDPFRRLVHSDVRGRYDQDAARLRQSRNGAAEQDGLPRPRRSPYELSATSENSRQSGPLGLVQVVVESVGKLGPSRFGKFPTEQAQGRRRVESPGIVSDLPQAGGEGLQQPRGVERERGGARVRPQPFAESHAHGRP